MDNASKALIMAGAILISIAIVGVGVYIFSTATSTSEQSTQMIDTYTVNQLNSTLRSYADKKVKGSTVRDFLSYVDAINKKESFPEQINAEEGTSTTPSSYVNNKYYTITLTTGTDGYVSKYSIKAK